MAFEFPGYSNNWSQIKKMVKKRDGHQCQECYAMVRPEGYLKSQCAHIKSKAEGGDDSLDNLRTLCIPCHVIEHHKDPHSKGHMLNTNWIRNYIMDYLKQKPDFARKQGHYNKLVEILREWDERHGKETA